METTQKPVDFNSIKKMNSSKTLKVSLENSKAKIEVKQKGHKEGRMKITFKFGKDEAEGFVNFVDLQNRTIWITIPLLNSYFIKEFKHCNRILLLR